MEETKLLVVTDIHHGNSFETKQSDFALDLLNDFVKTANTTNAHFVVDLGDRINDHDHKTDYSLMQDVAQVFKKLAIRREHLLGNHDVHFLTADENATLLGSPVQSRSINVGDWHFIFWCPNTKYTRDIGFQSDDEAFLWLKNDLKKNKGPTILFCHVPQLAGQLTGNYWFQNNPWGTHFPNYEKLIKLISEHPSIQMTVGGHLHWPKLNTLHGVHHITLPSLIEGFYTNNKACGAWTEITLHSNIIVEIYGQQHWKWELPLRPKGQQWPKPRPSARFN